MRSSKSISHPHNGGEYFITGVDWLIEYFVHDFVITTPFPVGIIEAFQLLINTNTPPAATQSYAVPLSSSQNLRQKKNPSPSNRMTEWVTRGWGGGTN